MFTDQEISAGVNRLGSGSKLKSRDQRTLLGLFRIYLKDRVSDFPDLATRLSVVSDSGNPDENAAQLAALVLAFVDSGFSLAELSGGRSGLQTDKKGEMILKIQYGLTILDYQLPESFSGGIEAGNGTSLSGIFLFGTGSVKKDLSGGW